MNREHTIHSAADLISGPRHAEYGPAQKNFQRIAAGWAVILDCDVQPHQVALCMNWLKVARLIHSPTSPDGWRDMVGYAALGGELVDDE